MDAVETVSDGNQELSQKTPDDMTNSASKANRPRLKILLSAYACEPGKGSEPGIGWGMAQAVASYHDVWVLTTEDRRPSIEAYYKTHPPQPNIHWIYLDLPYWMRFWRKGERGRRIHYHLWQIWAYYAGKALYKEVNFDLIHHITYGSYWTPSFLSLLPPPFMWGPIGGGENSPKSFYKTFDRRGWLEELARDIIRRISEQGPFVKMTARRSKWALGTTKETVERLVVLGAKNVGIMPAIALSSDDYETLKEVKAKEGGPFRVFSVCRLLQWKGIHLGLEAFADFHKQHPESEYWIFGEGPQKGKLQKMVQDLNLTSSVRFMGRVPREEMLQRLAECDLLLHPSLHDSGAYVCLEAMAARRPVVCLDLGGPALLISDETGIKIDAKTPEQVISDITKSLEALYGDEDRRKVMGAKGNQRVRELFISEQKLAQILDLYEKILDEHVER